MLFKDCITCSYSSKTSHSQHLILKLSISVTFLYTLLCFLLVFVVKSVKPFTFYLVIVVFHVFYNSDETFYLSYCFTIVLLNVVFLQEVFDTLLTCWPLVFKAVSVMKSIWWKMLSVQCFYFYSYQSDIEDTLWTTLSWFSFIELYISEKFVCQYGWESSNSVHKCIIASSSLFESLMSVEHTFYRVLVVYAFLCAVIC